MTENLRPVHVCQGLVEFDGLFHCWAGTSEYAYAIVELKDGTVKKCALHEVTFLDRENNDD